MMEDQIICNFLFKITPLEIRQNQKIIRGDNKSIVVKLGTKEAKCKKLNQTIQLTMPVLYSRTLNEYCPIKGITKIYDVNTDGSEMICCVGAFQTQDLLNKGTFSSILQRDIGPFKLKMEVFCQKLQETSGQPEKREFDTYDSKLKKYESDGLESPYILDDSHHEMQRFDDISDSQYCSQISEDMKKSQIQVIGGQLLEERRANKLLEQKLEKNKLKMQLLKKKTNQYQGQIKEYLKTFQKFMSSVQTDVKGNIQTQVNDRRKELIIKLSPNPSKIEVVNLFNLIKEKARSKKVVDDEVETEIDLVLMKVQELESQNITLVSENNKMSTQILNLKAKNREFMQSSSFKKQSSKLQSKVRKLTEQMKGLQGMNQYLRDKDTQMQNIITTKESTIENLRQMMSDCNAQLQNQQKVINNLQLTIEEMKEENANLSQTIEGYREKYGDLKIIKDKALQRQIRDCLRWIDQQNREEQFNLQDTMEPSVTSFIKSSIQDIEHMPLEQISVIRGQILNILKRVDELIAKNSL